MPGLLGITAIVTGLACILADQQIGRAVGREEQEPESGAASARVLGLMLFVAGGLALLTWAP